MDTLDIIKHKLRVLYETNPEVHVNFQMTHPKIDLHHSPAKLCGIYPHVFRLEECTTGTPLCHTLQYKDILTGQIEIVELNKAFAK
ncbi:MAG: hypothetical protein E7604_01130 [Ruminococcaceae bacterium]|nr:hypothetical protein [Oscillospiraceae bacterium]